MLAIELPPEIESKLEALAASTGRSKSEFVTEALIEHIADLEDLNLAEQRLAEARASGESFVSLEELKRRYDLAG